MTATLTVSMDNAAFEPSQGTELARILRVLADRIDGYELVCGSSWHAMDINGNRVGELEFSHEPRSQRKAGA